VKKREVRNVTKNVSRRGTGGGGGRKRKWGRKASRKRVEPTNTGGEGAKIDFHQAGERKKRGGERDETATPRDGGHRMVQRNPARRTSEGAWGETPKNAKEALDSHTNKNAGLGHRSAKMEWWQKKKKKTGQQT